jgi:hypothetical protein
MTYRKSRAQRETAFLEVAARLYAQLEDWYDQHPTASLGELEIETRRVRQELMRHWLGLIIDGHDMGIQVEPPKCPRCDQPMQFVGYRPWNLSGLDSDTDSQPAYYVCRGCEKQIRFHPQSQAATAGAYPPIAF